MGVERSKASAKKARYRRAAEERRWAAMSGPLTVRKVEPKAPIVAGGSEPSREGSEKSE